MRVNTRYDERVSTLFFSVFDVNLNNRMVKE